MHLAPIDGLIIAIYGVFVLGIGFVLRRKIVHSSDFFLAGRSIPAWVAGLAFLSANLGAQEVIGMAASGAKYGILTSHFYWVGAIPAMVFVGVFMVIAPLFPRVPFSQASGGPENARQVTAAARALITGVRTLARSPAVRRPRIARRRTPKRNSEKRGAPWRVAWSGVQAGGLEARVPAVSRQWRCYPSTSGRASGHRCVWGPGSEKGRSLNADTCLMFPSIVSQAM